MRVGSWSNGFHLTPEVLRSKSWFDLDEAGELDLIMYDYRFTG
jgi:hypothetical protein